MEFLLLILFTLVSCDQVPSRTPTPKTKTTTQLSKEATPLNKETSTTQSLPLATSFSTHLYPYLAISGKQCKGGETTRFDGQIIFCNKDQWLITIDNMNTCDERGCTSIVVDAFVAKLELDTVTSTNQFRFFTVTAESTNRARQRQILREVNFRANRAGKIEVIRKYY